MTRLLASCWTQVALVPLVLVALVMLSGCGPEDREKAAQRHCFESGGAYFEWENTSAGHHTWCVTPEGERIEVEGDGNHD